VDFAAGLGGGEAGRDGFAGFFKSRCACRLDGRNVNGATAGNTIDDGNAVLGQRKGTVGEHGVGDLVAGAGADRVGGQAVLSKVGGKVGTGGVPGLEGCMLLGCGQCHVLDGAADGRGQIVVGALVFGSDGGFVDGLAGGESGNRQVEHLHAAGFDGAV